MDPRFPGNPFRFTTLLSGSTHRVEFGAYARRVGRYP